MKISKLLSPELIKTELETQISDDILEIIKSDLRVERIKELLIREFVDVLNLSGKVQSENKLYLDLLNRERKASTAIGEGIAIPHVRTMHVREFLMGFAKSTSGYEYDSPDGGKTNLFFIMVSPGYDDNLYLKVYRELVSLLRFEELRNKLRSASSVQEIIGAIQKWE
ncbi:MAG: PTS sugar transporter subunit IIA [candidate division Zixibacteria bacterium]|nr:PTS sugar transporter subunit IIA [candidate division Zixibacteria bacterium]